MIKNFLYSFFLHITIFGLIYFGFKINKIHDINPNQVVISIANFNKENQKSFIKEQEKKQENPVEKVEKKEEKKPIENNNKEKKEPKKSTKKLENKSTNNHQNKANQKSISDKKTIAKKEEEQKEKLEEKLEQKTEEKPEEKIEEKIEEKAIEDKINQQEVLKQEEMITQEKPIQTIQDQSGLSVRERVNIQAQLKSCYKIATSKSQPHKFMTVLIKVNIDKNGYITANFEEILDIKRYNDPKEIDYKIVVDNVKKAIDLCSPLRNLPLEKFEIWKDAILEFDEE